MRRRLWASISYCYRWKEKEENTLRGSGERVRFPSVGGTESVPDSEGEQVDSVWVGGLIWEEERGETWERVREVVETEWATELGDWATESSSTLTTGATEANMSEEDRRRSESSVTEGRLGVDEERGVFVFNSETGLIGVGSEGTDAFWSEWDRERSTSTIENEGE